MIKKRLRGTSLVWQSRLANLVHSCCIIAGNLPNNLLRSVVLISFSPIGSLKYTATRSFQNIDVVPQGKCGQEVLVKKAKKKLWTLKTTINKLNLQIALKMVFYLYYFMHGAWCRCQSCIRGVSIGKFTVGMLKTE